MQFTYGDKCWNGPDRSLTVLHINAISQAISFLIKNVLQQVRLRCGLKNELTDVDEPSRCEYDLLSSLLFLIHYSTSYSHILWHSRYSALLSTPALCVEEKLKVFLTVNPIASLCTLSFPVLKAISGDIFTGTAAKTRTT